MAPRGEEGAKDFHSALTAVFRKYDENGDGTISTEELRAVLGRVAPELTAKELDLLFTQMDTNRDGVIQYEEFVSFVEGGEGTKVRQVLGVSGEEADFQDIVSSLRLMNAKQLREVFTVADVDRKGHLRLDELRRVLFPACTASEAQPGARRSSNEEANSAIVKVFMQMDKNADGKVRCAEFVSYVLQVKKAMSSLPEGADIKQIAGSFDALGGNAAGSVSLEALEKMMGASTEAERQMIRDTFRAIDRNSDGVLSITEFSRMYGKELVKEAKGVEVQWKDVSDDESSDEEIEVMIR